MCLDLTKQLILEHLRFRHTCAGTTHKIAVVYLGRGQVLECKVTIFELAKFDEHWISRYKH